MLANEGKYNMFILCTAVDQNDEGRGVVTTTLLSHTVTDTSIFFFKQ